MNAQEKLIKARCRLIAKEPFYGTFAVHMKWIPCDFEGMDEDAKTLGVRIVNKQIECLYYPPFIEKHNIDEVVFFIQHEIEHIVRLHLARRGDRIQQIFNIAADMTIHGHMNHPKIGIINNDGQHVIPTPDKWCWVPPDWADNDSFENYYDKLMKNAKIVFSPDGQPMTEEMKKHLEKYGITSDNHDVWEQSNESDDEMRQIVKHVVDEALEKTKGSAPGHLKDAIEALQDPIIHWRQILKHFIGRHAGNKRQTWSRRNRRIRRLGFKGTSRHAASTVNVIVDTSGSIGQNELSMFFAEIEAILSYSTVKLIQWDTQLQSYGKYRRGDWKKIDIRGRGGTMMEKSVDWLEENRLIGDLQIMLTDGYTDWPTPRPYPMLFVITTNVSGPNWGSVVRLGV